MVTKLKDGAAVGVDLEAVMLDEPIQGGTRLYLAGVQLEVKETQAQLWPVRDIAAEVAAATDPARQQAAANALEGAQRQPVDQAQTITPTTTPDVTSEAMAVVPPAPLVGVPTTPVFVDPAIWERKAAEAREQAAEARARADEAATAAATAAAAVTDIGAQMTASLRAQGVTWPGEAPPAPPAPPAESAKKPTKKKAAPKKAAPKKPTKKAAR